MRVLGLLLVLSLFIPASRLAGGEIFVRGDANGDASIDISDVLANLFHLGAGRALEVPLDAVDVNDDGLLDFSDPVYTLVYLFLAGPPPGSPFPGAGFDPTTTDPHTGGDEGPVFTDTPRPDLVARRIGFEGESGPLSVVIANEGRAEVPGGLGTLAVFVDGHEVERVRLADLEDQGFRSAGSEQTILTDVLLGGELRRVGVFVDADREIEESNEFQNTLTRTVSRASPDGIDLIISELRLSETDALEIVIENVGSPAAGEIDGRLEISVGERLPGRDLCRSPLSDRESES